MRRPALRSVNTNGLLDRSEEKPTFSLPISHTAAPYERGYTEWKQGNIWKARR
jgi:hypothetical protein